MRRCGTGTCVTYGLNESPSDLTNLRCGEKWSREDQVQARSMWHRRDVPAYLFAMPLRVELCTMHGTTLECLSHVACQHFENE